MPHVERYTMVYLKVVVDIPLQVFPASKVREEIALLPPPERPSRQEQIRRAIPGLIGGKALTKSGLLVSVAPWPLHPPNPPTDP